MKQDDFNSFDEQTDNVILNKLSTDFNISVDNLKSYMKQRFLNYDDSHSLIWNVTKISDGLKVKEGEGKKLTFIEKILVNAVDFSNQQIGIIKKEEISSFLKKNLFFIAIGLMVAFVVIRKL